MRFSFAEIELAIDNLLGAAKEHPKTALSVVGLAAASFGATCLYERYKVTKGPEQLRRLLSEAAAETGSKTFFLPGPSPSGKQLEFTLQEDSFVVKTTKVDWQVIDRGAVGEWQYPDSVHGSNMKPEAVWERYQKLCYHFANNLDQLIPEQQMPEESTTPWGSWGQE